MSYLTPKQRAEQYVSATSGYTTQIVVCGGTGCIAGGAAEVYKELVRLCNEKGIRATVSMKKEEGSHLVKLSGCQGFCQMGPLVEIYPQDLLYVHVNVSDVADIVNETLIGGKTIDRLVYQNERDGLVPITHEVPFYAKQERTTLKLCGMIDAQDLDEYCAKGGYAMAEKAVLDMTDKEICSEILATGLKGRGGAGFPTGRKWDLTRIQPGNVKYIICNGDEGDPGAFMDRCILEGNPHAVLEGMIVAAKAAGGTQGYIYVRTEYPLACQRMTIAIEKAREAGYLGKNLFGSNFSFDIQIMEGAGAFVCGEETALIASVEGKRGMPTPKPPFPAEKGLFGKPTVINNVETLATIPVAMRMGAEQYAATGTASSSGTKTFALTGHVAYSGLIEVPFGATIRHIIEDIGGGVINDDGTNAGLDYKAVQIGGPSGGCLTTDHLDLPLDYENLARVGAMIGSGGLVVMNRQTCMVKIARYFMQFTQNESCGKCIVCREGTKQMLALLDDILEGKGTAETIALLEQVAQTVKVGSLCQLGKTAPNPVLTTLRYFRDEYNAHVFEGRCPAGACEAFRKYSIIPEKCKSCTLCLKACPVGAISGSKGVPYVIDQEACIKCGACVPACKFKAITL